MGLFDFFFLFLSPWFFLVPSFNIYLIEYRALLFFSIRFFIDLKNNPSYLKFFYLSFLKKFSFFLLKRFCFWIKLNELIKYKYEMLTSWYFAWFAFRWCTDYACDLFWCCYVVALEPSRWTFYSGGVVSTMK